MTAVPISTEMHLFCGPVIHHCTYKNCPMKSVWKVGKKVGNIIIHTYCCDSHYIEVKKLLEQIKSPVTEEGFNDAEATA